MDTMEYFLHIETKRGNQLSYKNTVSYNTGWFSRKRPQTIVYLQIFNEFVNQLTDYELTTGYCQQDGATCHTSNARNWKFF